jgi:tetratricopeptide (TPR) repeat protein
MNQPNWRDFRLEEGVLAEPADDGRRLVIWLTTDRDTSFQYWQRIGSVAGADVAIVDGLYTTAATAIKARQSIGGLAGRLWDRLSLSLGRATRQRPFVLPNGAVAAQCGDRQTGLLLVWSDEHVDRLEPASLQARWPEARQIQKLGERLFVVLGLPRANQQRVQAFQELPMPTADSPRAYAETLLASARQAGARDREATALADLGMIALNEGKAKEAIESLEQALAITQAIGDTVRESDVVGNLGMAMLAVGQPQRARSMFEREFAQAQGAGDTFAQKIALERLGLACWNLRDFHGALRLFDQALTLARQVGDRHQEANLLWHQAIQLAELGQREPAIARAEESIALFKAMGRPQAASYGLYLQKYRMGLVDEGPSTAPAAGALERSPQAYLGGSMVASMMADQRSAGATAAKPVAGPGLLRMALSATKAMAGFASSGFKIAPPDLQRRRLETCAGCEHHTGVRCRICGCFTNVKSRLVHEDCPIGKWPS